MLAVTVTIIVFVGLVLAAHYWFADYREKWGEARIRQVLTMPQGLVIAYALTNRLEENSLFELENLFIGLIGAIGGIVLGNVIHWLLFVRSFSSSK